MVEVAFPPCLRDTGDFFLPHGDPSRVSGRVRTRSSAAPHPAPYGARLAEKPPFRRAVPSTQSVPATFQQSTSRLSAHPRITDKPHESVNASTRCSDEPVKQQLLIAVLTAEEFIMKTVFL